MLSRSAARITRSISKLSRSASSKASSISTSKAPSSPSLPSTSGQSPNYAKTWSTSQRPRQDAYSETRFEQTALEFQPQPLSAMEMINAEPVRIVHGRKAVCDGGMGPLGHPKVFINLDKPGPRACGYCGIRFEQAPHGGHEH